ncbi:MAG TPA: ammonia-forming cytochrome c nitrite reductase subunit c552 [Symbiobacteriaceae bacterium]|nr:ammonia-forming cytochrome c nitrite reductase subunit c552 [Symbiobacteriaceae bacterium]
MKKALKIGSLVAALAAVILAGTAFMTETTANAKLPEYVGSQACLGCHSEKYEVWESSGHAHMVDQIVKPSDLPADPTSAPEALKAELDKADYIVAGHRFLARDPANGELKYLNVQYDDASKSYVAYKGGSSWDNGCAGCHSTGWNVETKRNTEMGIGCEACHGPGREHILGKGDRSQITVNAASVACGQCHNGSGKVASGTTWPVGYRPNMMSLAEVGFTYVKPEAGGPVPELNKPKMRQFAMWETSAHANATNLLIDRGPTYLARTECISCHSTSAGIAIKGGEKWDASTMLVNDGVSCVACHDPHNSNNPRQLRKDAQALCLSCHSVARGGEPVKQIGTTRAPHSPQGDMLQGISAIDVAPTKGAHSQVSCVECHMTEGNHLMKVVKPGDVMGSVRKDSCTACHTKSTPESRDVYLSMWEESIKGKVDAVKADVDYIDSALKANPNLLGDKKAAYENARANYWFVQKDKSNGAHNFEYAIKVITKAQKEIAAIRAGL